MASGSAAEDIVVGDAVGDAEAQDVELHTLGINT